MQIFLSTDFYVPNDFKRFYESMPVLACHREASACRLLDITAPTLRRYLTDFSNPPKAYVRLLYLESHYGKRHASIDLFNDLQHAKQMLRIVRSDNERLLKKIAAVNSENALLRSNNKASNFAMNDSFYAVA